MCILQRGTSMKFSRSIPMHHTQKRLLNLDLSAHLCIVKSVTWHEVWWRKVQGLLQGTMQKEASHVALVVKNLPANARDIRDTGLIPKSGRFPGGGNGNPLQYFWMENPMDRGTWWVTAHGVTVRHNFVTKHQQQARRMGSSCSEAWTPDGLGKGF